MTYYGLHLKAKLMNDTPLFAYRHGNSFIHGLPAWLKLILLFAIPTGIFFLPLYFLPFLSLTFFIFALVAGFSVKNQLQDIKPILTYGLFLAITYILNGILYNDYDVKGFLSLILKLITAMQCTALFFKTTSTPAFKESIEKIAGKKQSLGFIFFLNFIPILFNIWFQLDKTWHARGGKNNIKKMYVLIPIFLMTAFYKATQFYYAVLNRDPEYKKTSR